MRSIKHDQPARTVGGQTARLLNTLHDRSQSIFTRAEAAKITGISLDSASSLLHKAMKRGLVSRLKPGLFTIVPAELGSATEYMGDSYKVGQRLAGSAPSFISHASAMEIHRMVTQPQLVVYVSCTKRVVNRSLPGADFRFVLIKNDHFFGTAKHWVSTHESVDVSDPERTIIVGIRQPEYCG